MNNAKLKFLDNLYDETKVEIMKRVEAEVIIEITKKLKAMVSNNIITDAEAREFAKTKDINLGITVTTRTKTKETPVVPVDPCFTTLRTTKSSC